jgi:hypothetical protein
MNCLPVTVFKKKEKEHEGGSLPLASAAVGVFLEERER